MGISAECNLSRRRHYYPSANLMFSRPGLAHPIDDFHDKSRLNSSIGSLIKEANNDSGSRISGERQPAAGASRVFALRGTQPVLPALHDGSIAFGLGLVTGQFVGQGMLHLDPSLSRMRLRLDQTDIPRVLKLAGKAWNWTATAYASACRMSKR